MAAEEVILGTLINGAQPKEKIPLAGTLLSEAGRALEKRGLLTRGGQWQLTKEGIIYALDNGISPRPYDIFKDLPPVNDEVIPSIPSFTPNVQKAFNWRWWALKWIGLALAAGALELLIMQLTGYARVLW